MLLSLYFLYFSNILPLTENLDLSLHKGSFDDLYKWDRSLYGDAPLSEASRRKVFTDYGSGVGYGWFIRRGERRSVAINGRAPGFSASLERFIDDDVCVAMTSNIYSSITQTMADDLAALTFGENRAARILATPVKVEPAILAGYEGRYRFGADFVFNPNMVSEVQRKGEWLILISGGGGGTSYLIPQS